MANTYYNSQLTAEEIEAALEAINGILTQANNGKVLAISNGKFEARSVQWGGGSAVLEPLSVVENGDYTPEVGVDGFDEVHVAVPNSYTDSDEGKVVKNGALVAQTAHAIITTNGRYDTTENNSVQVNVSGGGSTLITKTITQNGTYNASSDNADGYSQVVVNVSGGSGDMLFGKELPSSDLGQDGDYYYRYTGGEIIPYSKFRLNITAFFRGSTPSGDVSCAELRLFDSNGNNITQEAGAVFSASSTLSGYPAGNAFDENNGTFWHGLSSDTWPRWIEVDLPNEESIVSFSITPRNGMSDFIGEFVLLGSNDGINWDGLYSYSGGISGWQGGVERQFNPLLKVIYQQYHKENGIWVQFA